MGVRSGGAATKNIETPEGMNSGEREREVGLLSLKTCNPKNIEGGLPPEAINCIMMVLT